MNRTLATALLLSVVVALATASMIAASAAQVAGLVETHAVPAIVSGELAGDAVIGQTFVARHPGLDRVDVLVATYQRQAAGTLVFHLRRASGGQADLVTMTVEAARIADNSLTTFAFPPLEIAPGEPLMFYLQAPQTPPGQALGVWGQGEAYPEGQAFFGSLSSNQIHDLAFRLHYSPPPSHLISTTTRRLTAQRPGLFGQAWVYLGLICLYLTLLSWIGLLLLPPAWLAEATAPWFAAFRDRMRQLVRRPRRPLAE